VNLEGELGTLAIACQMVAMAENRAEQNGTDNGQS
jgi:hypothetical protein